MTAYSRVLLKLSGEVLAGDDKFGINIATVKSLCAEIRDVYDTKTEIAIVIGGGNFFRGAALHTEGLDRSTADYMGMLATMMNCLAVQEVLENQYNIATRVLGALDIKEVAEPYIRRRALRHLELKRIVIFGAGTGNPYFSTDTAASLRALEIHAQIILKATKVDGIFNCDPMKNPDAKLYKMITHREALEKQLQVMDSTALSLCMDNNLPIQVFNMLEAGNIKKAVLGEQVGTMVRSAL